QPLVFPEPGFAGLHLAEAYDDVEPNCFELKNEQCPNPNITFWLYTKINPNGRRLSLKGFRPGRELKVLIHGFNGNRYLTPNAQLRSQFINMGYNVISVDYSNLAKEPCYSEAVRNIRIVGLCLAGVLNSLLYHELVEDKDIHVIGFGLGAHVAGFASNSMATVEHITALDPAKPLFLVADPRQKIDASDAKFVDVIHTDVMMLGLLEAVGHADFYVNMGISQPNCGPRDEMDTHWCYHNRSADYYAESIDSPSGFYGIQCSSLKDFVSGVCPSEGNVAAMGFPANSGANGRYFLDTNNEPPYAMGTNYNDLNRNVFGRTYVNDEIMRKMFHN
ncbi:hypothetical protein KR018_003181, partial [Drosophila ironensis]